MLVSGTGPHKYEGAIVMLTIGEFSRLSHVSARMLRYYDAMGLLRPDRVGENGYRYYSESQLMDLVRIERLKDYGFPLSEVRDLLDLSEEALSRRIHRREIEVYGEMERLRKSLRRMEADMLHMEGSIMYEQYHVILMDDPAQKVFSIRRTINVAQIHELFQELHREAAALGLRQAGPTQQLYHCQEFSYERMDVEAQMVVSGDAPGVTEKPARTCAAVIHRGPYEDIKYAYDALCAWMAQHPEYQICGPALERYLKDENMVSNPEEYETGVLFPIEKK